MAPDVNGVGYSPEEAIEMNLCPECGKSLEGKKAMRTHLGHWPSAIIGGAEHDEARSRQAMLKKYFKVK